MFIFLHKVDVLGSSGNPLSRRRSRSKNLLWAVFLDSPNVEGFSRNGILTIKRLSLLICSFWMKCASNCCSSWDKPLSRDPSSPLLHKRWTAMLSNSLSNNSGSMVEIDHVASWVAAWFSNNLPLIQPRDMLEEELDDYLKILSFRFVSWWSSILH